MSLIEKIDAEIDNITNECKAYKGISKREVALCSTAKINMANEIKQIILAEQKEHKPIKTKGDVIRESNKSLASVIEALVAIALGDTSFIDVERRLEWLNQPQEDTNEQRL